MNQSDPAYTVLDFYQQLINTGDEALALAQEAIDSHRETKREAIDYIRYQGELINLLLERTEILALALLDYRQRFGPTPTVYQIIVRLAENSTQCELVMAMLRSVAHEQQS